MIHPILLFGATSILGYNLARLYPARVRPFVTPAARARRVRSWPALNLQDAAWIDSVFEEHRPEILLYCHAVCDVPKCEDAPAWARAINVGHVRRVLAALPARTRLVYVSSDHVFGGDGVYDENSPPCPISVYGRTRVDAEELALARPGSLVIRIGLPIGPSPDGRTGHRDWLRYRLDRNLPVTIVRDEYRSAVWAGDLAARIMSLAQSAETGLCHVAATRAVSRPDLAGHLLRLSGMRARLTLQSRHQRPAPHLGRVELATIRRGALFAPLRCVLDAPGSA